MRITDFSIFIKVLRQFPIFSGILLNFRKSNLLIVTALIVLLTSCNYSDVEVTNVRRIEINSLNKDGIELTGEMKVHNPNGYKIHVKSTDADLYLDGRKAGKAHLVDKITVPANFDDYLKVHIRADFNGGSLELIPIIIGASVKRSANIKVEGKLKASTFIISKKIDFEYQHKASF